MVLLGQAVSTAEATGTIEPTTRTRSGLARAQPQMDDPAAALDAVTQGQELSNPAEEPAMRMLEGLALLELNRPEESVRAFSDAVIAADALLALTDRNVAALQTRAIALSRLAVSADDQTRATEAENAFARADAVTDATGVTADICRLLDRIAHHDRSGILAKVRAAKDRDDTKRAG